MNNVHWPITEEYLKKEKCCVVGCKKHPKYEFFANQSEDPNDTVLSCGEHLLKGSVLICS